MVVVNKVSKWCRSWSTGIKKLGLESSSGHLCFDLVLTYEGSTSRIDLDKQKCG